MQPLDRGLPVVAINQIVPVRYQVAERAALVTERDAAVHAARRLTRQLFRGIGVVNVTIVADSLVDRTRRRFYARVFDETRWSCHCCAFLNSRGITTTKPRKDA